MALSIARPKHRSLTNPSLVHLLPTSFSSSSNEQNDPNNNDAPQSESPTQSQSSFSSYFSDVKASLRQRHQQMENQAQNQYSRRPLPQQQQTSPLSRPSKIASLEEIKKDLSEFRRRTSVPPPTDPNASSHSQPISFQELYKRNLIVKSEAAAQGGTVSRPPKPSGVFSFEAIRQSLRQMRPNREANIERRGGDPISLDTLKNNLRLKPADGPAGIPGSTVIGGTGGLPFTVFGKEMKENKEEKGTEATGTEFVKMYKYDELGEKLRSLRPEDGVKEFNLHEFSERLVKLREIEEKEAASRASGFSFKDLRDSLNKLKTAEIEKTRKTTIQRFDILGQLDGTPDFMRHPPQEQLVEKYFHPDNMSSAEKMKIELAKVRDEFKMSESDCGSSRVQVAQLTIKIKHLSSVLHKKDKHSRKGLIAMVQKRKSILKYLRRTDWDSYCLVLDKLGLRDNTGYKNLARPQ
ncbi:hypothetical protein HS088_TW12G00246 [Tripterygium wilfordii]|uniref:Small ribosomal subunit protein uS15c n=1 Tax=Tripterygium wilfordii TaxID=458696 RepID=A0A7J7CYG2_TRIWF|nr:uncharacterized protein LOC120010970 [Tripterygium wilfordii]KAF5739048.1 hypothetical protein HS088_TW12G00246 [Tripterygium wilfordii]